MFLSKNLNAARISSSPYMNYQCDYFRRVSALAEANNQTITLARSSLTAILIYFALIASEPAHSQTPTREGVKWQHGPSTGILSRIAEVRVPAGYLFAGANDTRVLMEAMHNPTSGK